MSEIDPHEFWDIEGQVVSGLVKALGAFGIHAVDLFADEEKRSSRVELVANLVGSKDRQADDAKGNIVHIEYAMQVMLEIRNPYSSPDVQRRWRGIISGLIARFDPVWINRHLPYGVVHELMPGDSTNLVEVGEEHQDELITTRSFNCTYTFHGIPPVQPVSL